MTLKLFITGTDTGIGKTYVALRLLQAFNSLGYKTIGIKPVASGATHVGTELHNDDAMRLLQASSYSLSYKNINPFVFEKPIAPHIAANQLGVRLTVKSIKAKLRYALTRTADVFIIEGAGGWLVPLNEKESISDLAIALRVPILLVVGIRLGCINHALLTVKAIEDSGAELLGWVANCIDPEMLECEANILALKGRIKSRCLGILPNERCLS
jgi:dethiobiotin synthetase